MKTMKQWASTIFFDAILIAAAYFWLAEKIEGAGNIFLFIAWFFALYKLVIGFSFDSTWFEKNPLAPGIRTHSMIARPVLIGVLVWTGSFWTAGIYVLATLMYEAARLKEPTAKDAA